MLNLNKCCDYRDAFSSFKNSPTKLSHSSYLKISKSCAAGACRTLAQVYNQARLFLHDKPTTEWQRMVKKFAEILQLDRSVALHNGQYQGCFCVLARPVVTCCKACWCCRQGGDSIVEDWPEGHSMAAHCLSRYWLVCSPGICSPSLQNLRKRSNLTGW